MSRTMNSLQKLKNATGQRYYHSQNLRPSGLFSSAIKVKHIEGMSQEQSARSQKQFLDLHDKAESIFKERPSNEDPNLPKVLSNISHLNPDDD